MKSSVTAGAKINFMILDTIKNWRLYETFGARLAQGLQLLHGGQLTKLPPGKHPIDGELLFANIQEYAGIAPKKGRWEAHHKYIDIQCVLQGSEIMGYTPVENLKVENRYSAAKDVAFYKGGVELGTRLVVEAGMFTIFYPGDAHMPMLRPPKYAGRVKKVVLKVLAE
jgi:YhcH/YjgK/YiaL family protein